MSGGARKSTGQPVFAGATGESGRHVRLHSFKTMAIIVALQHTRFRAFPITRVVTFTFIQPCAAQTKSKIIPSGWLPSLAPSIRSALDQLKEANSQMEMNLLSRQIADMTDAQLFIAYVRLYEKLPVKDRAALVAEQEKWLRARPNVAAAGVESEGGSLAPLEANNAEVTFTEKRLKELRARFKTITKNED
jgi:uncharacterized protein YecT (DUF1311 family)